MITVKHPLNHCNLHQEEMIRNLPDEQKDSNELLFSFGNATYRYHSSAHDKEPTIEDYNEWLEGLEQPVKKGMQDRGFESCKTVLSFTRYVVEKNDVGMDEYVRNLMGEQDYDCYRKLLNNKHLYNLSR